VGRVCLAQAERKRKVAAENHASFVGEPVGKTGGDRAHAGDRHHPEADAGNEHVKAPQSAAQLARGDAQREQNPVAPPCAPWRDPTL